MATSTEPAWANTRAVYGSLETLVNLQSAFEERIWPPIAGFEAAHGTKVVRFVEIAPPPSPPAMHPAVAEVAQASIHWLVGRLFGDAVVAAPRPSGAPGTPSTSSGGLVLAPAASRSGSSLHEPADLTAHLRPRLPHLAREVRRCPP
jgi:hypothetical protein